MQGDPTVSLTQGKGMNIQVHFGLGSIGKSPAQTTWKWMRDYESQWCLCRATGTLVGRVSFVGFENHRAACLMNLTSPGCWVEAVSYILWDLKGGGNNDYLLWACAHYWAVNALILITFNSSQGNIKCFLSDLQQALQIIWQPNVEFDVCVWRGWGERLRSFSQGNVFNGFPRLK